MANDKTGARVAEEERVGWSVESPIVDSEVTVEEVGELVGAIEWGVIKSEDVAGSLADLARGRVERRQRPYEIIVFKLGETAIFDLLATVGGEGDDDDVMVVDPTVDLWKSSRTTLQTLRREGSDDEGGEGGRGDEGGGGGGRVRGEKGWRRGGPGKRGKDGGDGGERRRGGRREGFFKGKAEVFLIFYLPSLYCTLYRHKDNKWLMLIEINAQSRVGPEHGHTGRAPLHPRDLLLCAAPFSSAATPRAAAAPEARPRPRAAATPARS